MLIYREFFFFSSKNQLLEFKDIKFKKDYFFQKILSISDTFNIGIFSF
jgi:hypothetical protein